MSEAPPIAAEPPLADLNPSTPEEHHYMAQLAARRQLVILEALTQAVLNGSRTKRQLLDSITETIRLSKAFEAPKGR